MITPHPRTKNFDELKHPGLRGEFQCAVCLLKFAHRASLTRHRHKCGEHTCNLCSLKIGNATSLRLHMAVEHNLSPIYTCGCCGFTFESREMHHEHMKHMKLTGTVGDVLIIATTGNEPGSLKQVKDSENVKAGSLSPSPASSVASSSASSNVSTRQTTPVEDPQSEYDKLMNETMEKILDSGRYSGDELEVPDNWYKIIDEAHKMVTEKMNGVEKMSTDQPRKRGKKRERVD